MDIADITILYGSQTGNAEDLARRIGYKAKSSGFMTLVEAIDDFPLKCLPKQKFVIFVCSTTGHGQEPENMRNFYNFIKRRDLPKTCLSDLKYTVYGLGDSSYAKFNYVSKIIFKRLKECGAKPQQELVTGDEQHHLGCDGVIYPKLEELWSQLGVPNTDFILTDSSYEVSSTPDSTTELKLPFKTEFSNRYDLKTATCVVNQRVTSNLHFQDTRLLCFRSEDPLEYEPGDVCAILPANTDESTDMFIRALNLDPEMRINLKKRDTNYMVNYLYDFVPDGIRMYDVVKYYFDIQSIPRRSFFQYLWPFSQSDLERDKLKEFATTAGQGEMYDYCIQPRRSILEVLLDFPNTVGNIGIEYLFDMIPPIKARSFSIASSPKVHLNEVHLIVGVVKYKTRLRKTRVGLCSNYLANIVPVDRNGSDPPDQRSNLKFFLKRSNFKLPTSNQTPIIMIGPGLGIAPFRGFIEERAIEKTQRGKNFLYFGCRFSDADYYFREELVEYDTEQVINLRVAFSREQPKQYVQDLLLEDSTLINRLVMADNATIYVAGNSKLPEDLRSVLKTILVVNTGDTIQSRDGEKLVARLEAENRIQYDCW